MTMHGVCVKLVIRAYSRTGADCEPGTGRLVDCVVLLQADSRYIQKADVADRLAGMRHYACTSDRVTHLYCQFNTTVWHRPLNIAQGSSMAAAKSYSRSISFSMQGVSTYESFTVQLHVARL